MNPLLSRLRPGSTVRGAGVAVACLVPGVTRRAEVLGVTYAAAWPIDRPGVQFLSVVPDEDDEAWKRLVIPIASSAASWTTVMTLATLGVRRLRLPTPVGAVLLGAGIAAADTAMAGWAETQREKAAAARKRAEVAQAATAPEAR